MQSSSLVGRENEIRRLGRLLDDLEAGSGSTAVIRGVAGAGKTSLLRVFLAESRRRNIAVVAITGLEGGEPFGLQSAGQLLASLSDELVARDITVPDFADSAQSPTVVARQCAARLVALAERSPVVLCLDDAHWFDRSSAESFLRLAQLVFGERVLVVAATRPVDAEAGPSSMVGVCQELIELGGLSVEDGRTLLEFDGAVADEVAQTCWSIAAGNPLALRSIRLDARQRTGEAPLDASVLRSAARVDIGFGESFGRLGASARSLVASLAVSTVDPLLLRRISNQPQTAFDEAVQVGLLDEGTGTFRHPLMRPAVLDRLGPAETRDAHHRIAVGLQNEAVEPEARAWHLAASVDGRSSDAAEELAKTAVAARDRGAVREAMLLFERSADIHPDPERRAALLVDAADAAWLRNETERVNEYLDLVRVIAPTSHAVAAKAAEVRAHAVMWTEGPAPALAIIEEAVNRIEGHLPDLAVSLLAVATVFAETIPDGRRILKYADRAEALAQDAGPFAAVAAQFAVATGSAATGDNDRAEAAYATLDPIIAMLADMSAPEFEHVLGAYGALQTNRERWIEGRTLLEKLLLRADRLGAASQSTLFAHSLGHIEWYTGDWLRALSLARRSQEADRVGAVAHALGRSQMALIEACLGLANEARASVAEVEQIVARTGTSAIGAIANWAHSLLLIGEGDDEGALTQAALAHGVAERGGINEVTTVWWHAELVESLWATGRRREAATEMEAFRGRSLRLGRRAAPTFAARLEGLLHDDPAAALAAFDESERLAVAAELPFARARSSFARARWLVAHGELTAAARAAEEARSQFDRLGASLFSNRAGSLVPHSAADPLVRPAPPSSSSIGLLSPAELRVVEVIVRGATIKQAAELLILSSKTIDAHLQQVYRKLGIRSRAELASRFERERPPAA